MKAIFSSGPQLINQLSGVCPKTLSRLQGTNSFICRERNHWPFICQMSSRRTNPEWIWSFGPGKGWPAVRKVVKTSHLK